MEAKSVYLVSVHLFGFFFGFCDCPEMKVIKCFLAINDFAMHSNYARDDHFFKFPRILFSSACLSEIDKCGGATLSFSLEIQEIKYTIHLITLLYIA